MNNDNDMIYKNRYWNNYILGITLFLTAWLAAGSVAAQGVVVHGSVYGGGNLADVKTNTEVNMSTGTVAGNVFGGGKGSDYNYLCDKAMVGVMNEGAGQTPGSDENKNKGTKVTITGGTVGTLDEEEILVEGTGNVYGGGEIGRVEWNTQVTIGVENQTSGDPAPVIYGSVFGAGAGNETHGFAALVRGNSTVTIQGKAKVLENVYGGGEMATAGRYWVKGAVTPIADGEEKPDEPGDNVLPSGMPYATRGGGVCTVIIQDNAQIGPDAGASTTAGHVFGAGKGVNPHFSAYNSEDEEHSSRRMADTDSYVYFTDDSDDVPVANRKTGLEKYLQFLQTLALATQTHVTISDNVTVKGNVYGGSESGFVQDNTSVAIEDGEIGTSGTTFGNVFGGGKGLTTFFEAGIVKGTTTVAINGGTTYGSVYGGGELGSINGTTTTTMSDGTVKGNVFGGGKGKADNFTCDKAMVGIVDDGVDETVEGEGDDEVTTYTLKEGGTTVTIIHGTVEGNVYGGGEVGRVERNTIVTIGEAGNTSLTPVVKGHVFGAGKGEETHGYSALVRGNSTVTIQGKAEVWQNVHGGGEKASVGRYQVAVTPELATQYKVAMGMPCYLKAGGKCTVNIQDNATIGKAANTGDVYGAGQGVTPSWTYNEYTSDATPYTTRITNSKRMVNYGSPTDHPDGKQYSEWDYYEDEDHHVDNRYVWEYFTTEDAYLRYMETLGRSSETDVVIGGTRASATTFTPSTNAPTIKGTVYGGSESGFVYYSTVVNMLKGTVDGDIFGGGKGLPTFAEAGRVRINTNLTISDDSGNSTVVKGNVYGGGSLGDVGIIDKTNKDDKGKLTYNYAWKQTDGTTANTAMYNLPSDPENEHDTSKNTGICNVTITGGSIGSDGSADADHGNVFGAGRGTGITWWCEKGIAFATNVSVSGSTVVYGNVYGGGQVGRVEDDGKVTIGTASDTGEGSKPDIRGDVFGAGAGLETHGYSALLRGNSNVTVQGIAKVGGNVYGGGETASVGRFTVVGGLPKEPQSGGYCTVTIKDEATIGTSSTGGNVYGACKGVTPTYEASGDNRSKSMQLLTNAPENTDLWSHYNGDESSPFIWRYYETEADYLAFLRTLALTSNPNVTIGATRTWNESTETESFTPSADPSPGSSSETPTVYGSVYGGGQRGITLGKVDVNIVHGIVFQDVYGGGALADTNAGNWDADGYTEVTGLSSGDPVTGLYTRSGTEGNYTYTETAENATSDGSTTYYSKGKWADAVKMTRKYKTTVDLLGGYIKGDAYGGGLGQKTGFNSASSYIPAVVWGDIDVTLDGTKFDITYSQEEGHTDVVESGRVFGCNNLLGSPQGNVTVTVEQTVAGNTTRTTAVARASNKTIMDNNPDNYTSVDGYVTPTYEVAAVYGGGNLAPYTATDKKAHVIINGCELTSIQTVYGGGNAAPVTETDVDINSCYEIGAVFGGGNGKDMYKMGDDWKINPGANVNGNANTLIFGGTVHEAYGGSNEKGTIYGDVVIDIADSGLPTTDPKYCQLDVAQLVGAGKNADVNGDLKIIMGCKPSEKIPIVFGGADNANVNGDVELTITSGWFGKVFGGNNNGGRIKGHIILNIQETTCIPLNIDHLYLCGNNAAYSQYGYYVMTEETEDENGDGIGDPSSETPILSSVGKLQLVPRESANDPHLPVDTYTYTYDEETGEAGATWTVLPTTGNAAFTGYAAPVLNVTSCTSIGEVFGGGYGATATVYGNPTVNINMIPGAHADEIDRDGDDEADDDATLLGEIGDVYGGGDAAAVYGNTTVNIGTKTKESVYVFAQENGEYKVQYETDRVTPQTQESDVQGAYITGDVYGGGKLANVGKTHLAKDSNNKDIDVIDIEGSTFVNIGAVKGSEILDAQSNGTGRYNYTSVSFTPADAPGIFIGGNVYGGGKGEAAEPVGTDALPGAFRCGKAMVTKNTNVAIGNGTIGDGNADHGHVYGGGEKGRVEENTTVTIGCENDANSKPVITGNVFGAGRGVNSHGYSALARGNSYVTVQGEAKVKKSVYGGGEIASVGKYNINAQGLPESLANQNSGYCTVIVRDNAVIGPDAAMVMTAPGYPDDKGHVFGGGKGVLPYEGYADNAKAWRVKIDNKKQEYLSKDEAIAGTADESTYLPYVETLGLATQTYVTIDENAFVKGSVYGGSENGYVQHDTQVNIRGNCQIGNGYVQMADDGTYLATANMRGVNRRYTAKEWEEGHLFVTGDTEVNASDPTEAALRTDVSTNYTSSLPECASWPYGQASETDKYAPWDKYADVTGYDSKGGRTTADDGHTFYGNVFGGGSGVIPYRPGKWHPEAGSVGGNTEVNITGGHILTNIYGGNELTDVYGKCTVNFGGTATLGVPRTLKQIAAHPLTCYLFGAGKGDQRVLFNKKTNVKDVEVNITGGWIYGSVFGGGEDGHVHHNVTMTINESDYAANNTNTRTKIGTWGTTYVDGNVFGGGRGFGADAYTAGNVAGTVTMTIESGTILGSIYGGGRLGSVGYGLFDEGADGYGEMRPDGEGEASNPTPATNFKRGHVYMTIGKDDGTGPTIGNTWEYKIPSASNGPMTTGETPTPTLPTDISTWTTENWTTWREYNHVPKTEYEYNASKGYHMLTHTKGGNVFAGGMGNFYRQDGSTLISGVDWWKLGNVKSTTLTIKGGTIKSNVYGGGELGQVTGHHTTQNANYGTEITIQGSNTTIPTIGTEVKDASNNTQYTFGSVFGSGYGSLMDEIEVVRGTSTIKSNPKFIAGLVKEDTKIDMQNGAVKASIYGGGEMASVGESTTSGGTTTVTGSTYVSVSGGTVGIAPIEVSDALRYFGGSKMGNVYGGGSGHNNTVRSGRILKNTNVTISDGTIYHNVYGGGAYGTVGDFDYQTGSDYDGGPIKVQGINGLATTGTGVANVTITGGIIGYDGKENGMVFGSSRGDINRPGARDDHTAWVYDTHVTIGTSGSQTGPQINGTVYGSGENGHVFHDTEVNVYSGTIGIYNSTDAGYTVTSGDKTYNGAEYPYRGNVYGGGCGTDMYYSGSIPTGHTYNDGEGDTYNSLAGIVNGNATVNITGGHVVRNVYGAGAMGSVGKVTTTEGVTTIPSGGLTTINISGGTIGVNGNNGDGNVFGAARGDAFTTQTDVALVKNTGVSIGGSADIKGSVYGGGETGDVQGNTEVNVCAEKQTNDNVVSYVVASGTPTIGGNVFGGGMGVANSFECAKAMVGIVNDGVTGSGTTESPYVLQPGGTTVRIYNGTVGTLEGELGSQTLKAGTGNVYGGGEIARVERNTSVEIGAAAGTTAPIIRGSVFAAGAGKETHGYSALVRGTSTVTVQGGAQVLKNVYGGGEKASVGRYKVKTPLNADDDDVPSTLPLGMPARLLAGGTSTVNIQGDAEIGTAGDASTGHVYGAGQGVVPSYTYTYSATSTYNDRMNNSKRMVNHVDYVSSTDSGHNPDDEKKTWDYYVDDEGNQDTRYVWEYFPTEAAYLQFVETLAISAATHVTIGGKRDELGVITLSGDPNINGSVFGGSESGFVYRNTDVKIKGGTVKGDAFGGGRGLESFAEAGRVRWNTNLAISGDNTVIEGNVYGGGNMGDVGTIYKDDIDDKGNLTYNYKWKNTDANGNNLDAVAANDNTLGNNTADADNNKNTGICTVDISGGTIGLASTDQPTRHGNVFGAGQGSWHTWWCEKAIAYATDVSVSGGTIYGNVYGGGEVGRVEDDAKVTIGMSGGTGTDKPNITGSVFGGGAGLQTHGYSALVRGNSEVTVQGKSKVGGNVYGGGEIASVGRFKVVGGLPSKPKGGGTCTVVVKENAVTGDVYGSCKGVTPNYVESGDDRSKSMQLEAYKGTGTQGTDWDYFRDENGTEDRRFVWVYYTTKDDYLAFIPTLGLASNTHVTIGGSSTVNGSVFGGGQRGITLGGVDVNINGGTVSQDVYGGGALANSNSSHWHNGERTEYVELDELYKGISLKGYYTKSGDTYTLITEGTASGVTTDKYYAIFKTNVNLKGGTVVRNVYGGGLGQLAKAAVDAQAAVLYADVDEYNTAKGTSLTAEAFGALSEAEKTKTPAVAAQAAQDDIEAKVYGDVLVKLNEPTTPGDDSTCGNCVVKGTIFGCNNLNGSPQNDVTVHIYKTVGWTENKQVTDDLGEHTVTVSHDVSDGKADPTIERNGEAYELAAVYGGGNLAAYYPDDETARASAIANVIIDGCNLTSIKTVYGGGNAASVPATEVTVNGTYEIGQVFGGGNGYDNYQLDGKWYQNPGANVGYQNYTHLGTGGGLTESDPILAVDNDDASDKTSRATYAYGIGKTHATIYGGTVHAVYGGSNKRGNVRVEARTTLEDQDVNDCDFEVGEAYGGGNNAEMDGDAILEIGCISGLEKACGGAANADVNGNVELNITNGTYSQVFGGNDLGGAIRGSITVNIEEIGCRPIIIGELYGGGNRAAYSVYGYDASGGVLTSGGTKQDDPVVNVKSFTSIGKIFGGGYGAPAKMVASPTVNINVYEGKYYNTESGDKSSVINDNARVVKSKVKYVGQDGYNNGYPVPSHQKGKIGAIGTVYGGGNEAEMIGTPTVNIGTEIGNEVYGVVTATLTPGETSVEGYYTYSPASYNAASGYAVEGVTYYEENTVNGKKVYEVVTETLTPGETSVEGYFTYSPASYNEASGKAVAGTTYYQKIGVKGADIRDNVYGGGNNAKVTGNTNVVIGKEAVTP